ncbi:hypothetical protein DPMN_118441 [Dreissena polymorpha]|uniref:Fucosyltransferase n=1 Tax=Dreissena polymorpha TaxID=45954 RepID=A0A9D4GGF5_DREPO|nr:hypothetical protein DPMN_118441 [Dreissena polymorpha]
MVSLTGTAMYRPWIAVKIPVFHGATVTMSIDVFAEHELTTTATLFGTAVVSSYQENITQISTSIKTNKKYDDNFKSAYFDNYTFSNGSIQEVKHTILYWNKPFWMKDVRDACLNCEVITNRSKARDASAIVFFGMADGIGKPPQTLEERNPNQAWIFSSVETPLHMFQEYMSSEWQGKFNWTWTYRPSATFFQPYGIMLKKEYIPEKNYSDIFHRKSKLATWIVSHCQTDSKREIYVGQMNTYKNGTVDIFGGCGKYKPTWGEYGNVIKNYKFYISFENSFCSDYFSEKFFSAFSTDIIPVVRGGADYTKYVPNGTYIDTQDFRSPKELVDYLIQLASDEKMYTEILRRKDRYQLYAGWQLFGECVCRICQKLNDIDKHRATILNNSEIMGDCRSPRDLR